jgi:hypothetical protein
MRVPRRQLPTLLCVTWILGGTVHAQTPATYQFRVGDTLRYTQRTDGRVRIEMPERAVEVSTEHVAAIGMVLRGRDSLSAWYESLTLRQQGPGPQGQEPNTGALLLQPYALTISPRGEVRALAFPSMPSEVASITDLTRQFDDFFVTLPPGPLRPGLTWTDTLLNTRPRRPRDSYSSRHVRSYRVERDTVVLGIEAVVIRLDQRLRLRLSSPDDVRETTIESTLDGVEEGTAIFAPSVGRLLERQRRGAMQGMFSIVSRTLRNNMPQRYEYTSTLTLVP